MTNPDYGAAAGDFAMARRAAEYERGLMERAPMFRQDMYSVMPLNGPPSPRVGTLRWRDERRPELAEVLWTVS